MSESRIISLMNARVKQALAVLLMAGLLGCSQKNESQEDDSGEGYPLVGEILSVLQDEGLLEVRHEEIAGYMPAMTMRFKVAPGDMKNAKPGQKIRARLIRDGEGGFALVKIWPIDEEAAKDLEKFNDRLQKQAKELDSGRYYGEGDQSPDFALLDQFGKTVTSDRLKGKPFFLNFIFTRCTDAQMCPLSTSKMAQLQLMVKESGLDASFVSITLDPEFDTPGILRNYADAYGIDGSNYHFVTGPKSAVRDLVRSFGVTSMDNVDTIMHSLATVLIDENGAIIKRSEKSAWTTLEFLEALKKSQE